MKLSLLWQIALLGFQLAIAPLSKATIALPLTIAQPRNFTLIALFFPRSPLSSPLRSPSPLMITHPPNFVIAPFPNNTSTIAHLLSLIALSQTAHPRSPFSFPQVRSPPFSRRSPFSNQHIHDRPLFPIAIALPPNDLSTTKFYDDRPFLLPIASFPNNTSTIALPSNDRSTTKLYGDRPLFYDRHFPRTAIALFLYTFPELNLTAEQVFAVGV